MNCPLCSTHMRCIDSEEINPLSRIRIYECLPCNKLFNSTENLDPEGFEKRKGKYKLGWVSRKEVIKCAKSIHSKPVLS